MSTSWNTQDDDDDNINNMEEEEEEGGSSNSRNVKKKKSRREVLDELREEQTTSALINAALHIQQQGGLLTACLAGEGRLPTRSTTATRGSSSIPCSVVCLEIDGSTEEGALPCLMIPMPLPGRIKLVRFAALRRRLSKSVLLGLNAALVNRDGGLFDNLPWSTWSIDPQERNRDAANNLIDAKFHLGKRDAYNRFTGKDWQGRSLAIGNLALRLKYMLQNDSDKDNKDQKAEAQDGDGEGDDFDESRRVLVRRMLDLQIRECEMDVAEWDYQIAVARMNDPSKLNALEQSRQDVVERLEMFRRRLEEHEELGKQQQLQQEESDGSGSGNTSGGATAASGTSLSDWLAQLLDDIANWTTDYGKNAAPYRGAMGYAPMLDTQSDIEGSLLPYTSPYDFLKEILEDQLRCKVLGAALENTSLFSGTLAVGGVLVLQRTVPPKSVRLAGETVKVRDEDEDFGNPGITEGETCVVECAADEAIGMSLACNVPLRVEADLWQRAAIMAKPTTSSSKEREASENNSNKLKTDGGSIYDALRTWTAADSELSILVEGQARNRSVTERVSPLRIPRTTTSLWDAMFEDPTAATASSTNRPMFPTDNPIRSLDQYDRLSNEDKARTLLQMSNFEGTLPRPRRLRQHEQEQQSTQSVPAAVDDHPLDSLLLPRIDESVRRQYLIRDAERRGDDNRVRELRQEISSRQVAQEKAREARDEGNLVEALRWEKEAELFGSLRADVTQDEGSYNRFLDRDEWYERDRQKQAKKINKKQFGTLLDGIE